MRTTIDIEERELERAKKVAHQTGQTLGAVVSAALNAYFAATRVARSDPPFELLVRGSQDARFPSPSELEHAELEDDLARLGMRRAR